MLLGQLAELGGQRVALRGQGQGLRPGGGVQLATPRLIVRPRPFTGAGWSMAASALGNRGDCYKRASRGSCPRGVDCAYTRDPEKRGRRNRKLSWTEWIAKR